MKRHKDLIVEVLRHFEAQPRYGKLPWPKIAGVDPETLHYHIHLCVQAGFLETSTKSRSVTANLPNYVISGVTWKGHELLDPNVCVAH